MEIFVRLPKLQDYDSFSRIVDQVQQLHVDWRPDVYKPVSPLVTKERFEEILKGDTWYVAEADGMVVGVMEVVKRHVESPSQVTKDILFITSLGVAQEYRGKGIGHRFFEKVKQIKEEHGFDSIELQVDAKNTMAYEMYRHYGFTEKSINMELK